MRWATRSSFSQKTLAVGLVPDGDISSGEMDPDEEVEGQEEVLGTGVLKW